MTPPPAGAGPHDPCPLNLVLQQTCTADSYGIFSRSGQHPFTGMPHPVRHAALTGDLTRQPDVIKLVVFA